MNDANFPSDKADWQKTYCMESVNMAIAPTVRDIEQFVKRPDKLLTIRENANITEAAKKMADNHVGCLLVFDSNDKFAGVLTERDMLAKICTTMLLPNKVLVNDIMTRDAISCTMDTPVTKVEQLMDEFKIRHIPIVENGSPVAMVSSRDIIAYQLRTNKAMKTAAEQLAMLSTGLKSLDFEDVAALAVNEVPKSFGTERAVLYFPQRGSSSVIIYRRGCPLSEESLLEQSQTKLVSPEMQIVCSNVCRQCEKLGGQSPRLVIPFSIYEQDDENGTRSPAGRGFLCMCGLKPLSAESEKLQLYKAALLQEVLNVNLTNAKLYQDYQQARHDSETDVLTGAATRRALDKVLKAEFARAVRYNHKFSVAIVDLDNFKKINDTAGHATGDRVLQLLARFMLRNARTSDTIARYGGDEFVMLMPETSLSDAVEMLERLRHDVENLLIPNVHPITISCGIAEWLGSPDDTVEDMLKRADSALYEAKRSGRNQVIADQSHADAKT
jgi:diguanylate cyclase (GGDEF)-like protein